MARKRGKEYLRSFALAIPMATIVASATSVVVAVSDGDAIWPALGAGAGFCAVVLGIYYGCRALVKRRR